MNEKDWFVDWFDTSWYHRLYKKRNDKEAQSFIDHLVEYLGAKPKNNFMDLACGKGRHSVYLAEKGFKVVGLDLSKESIKIAKEQETIDLQFDVHDMRKIYGQAQFDYVLNLFTSFGYFKTDKEHVDVLINMRTSLRDSESLLVLDFLNADRVIADLCPKEVVKDGDTEYEISREVVAGFIKKKIVVVEGVNKYAFSERVRLYNLDDFHRLFAQAGLQIVKVFGDYSLNEFDESSPRLILIGKADERMSL